MKFIEEKPYCFYARGSFEYAYYDENGSIKTKIESFDLYEYTEYDSEEASIPPFAKFKVYYPKKFPISGILNGSKNVRIEGGLKSVEVDVSRSNCLENLKCAFLEYYGFKCKSGNFKKPCFSSGNILHPIFYLRYIEISKSEFLSLDKTRFESVELNALLESYDDDFLLALPKDFLFRQISNEEVIRTANYTINGGEVYINQCYCRRNYDCSHNRVIFDTYVPSVYPKYRISICEHYFRWKMSVIGYQWYIPEEVKARAFYQIIKEELGWFLYENEEIEQFCFMPYEETDPGCIFKMTEDLSAKRNGKPLEKYVVYLRLTNKIWVKYSVYKLFLYMCTQTFLEENDLNSTAVNIIKEWMRRVAEEIRDKITKRDYKDFCQNIVYIDSWVSAKSISNTISAIKKIIFYYTNLKQKNYEKRRSTSLKRLNVGKCSY